MASCRHEVFGPGRRCGGLACGDEAPDGGRPFTFSPAAGSRGWNGFPQPRCWLRPLDSRVAGRGMQWELWNQLREISLAVRVRGCDGNEGKIASSSLGLWGLRTSGASPQGHRRAGGCQQGHPAWRSPGWLRGARQGLGHVLGPVQLLAKIGLLTSGPHLWHLHSLLFMDNLASATVGLQSAPGRSIPTQPYPYNWGVGGFRRDAF